MTTRWFLAVALAAGLGLAGCGDDDDDDGGAAAPPPTTPPATCTPPATATAPFSTAVHPILTARCASCHGTSYGSATVATARAAAQARVDTANPEQSTLVQKGDGRVAHGGGDALDPGLTTTTEVTTVTTWITECAQSN
jgi:hypothetical protein